MKRAILVTTGLALVALSIVLALLSSQYTYGGAPLARPTLQFVALMMLAGAAYLVAVALVVHSRGFVQCHLAYVLLIGAAMRAAWFASTPILEDDFYRYLWDGGLVANGHNSFAYTPNDLRGADAPAALRALAVASGDVFSRVNHPQYGTIYPPVAQAVFALAHLIHPWSLLAWRAVLLSFDGATLALLFLLLRQLGLPQVWLLIYWWNPLLVKETVNSAHMDVLALPSVLGALWFVLRHRASAASVLLAIAAAIKVWPLALVPLMGRFGDLSRRRVTITLSVLGVAAAILVAPMHPVLHLGEPSGFIAYGKSWEMNDTLFMGLLVAAEVMAGVIGWDSNGSANTIARIFLALLLAAWMLRLCWTRAKSGESLCDRIALFLAAALLVGPTFFPWYYAWMLPFLALRPRASLLILTAMLPLYYLKFHFDARGNVNVFHQQLVWLEFAPTFALLAWEWFHARKKSPA